MKKTRAAVAALIITVTGYSQGTFIFNNRDPANGIDAKVVYLCDGQPVSTELTAQMYLVKGISLTPLLPMTTFRTGAAAGYVNAPTDPITVPGVPGGTTATLRMVVFNGSDYNSSILRASSSDFTIVLGGGGSPPTTPAPLIGLTGFTVQYLSCPEPTTIALGLLGMGALFIKMNAVKRSR